MVYSASMMNQSEQFVQAALDALPAHIAILDENGIIIGINEAWRRFGGENRYVGDQNSYGIGTNYLQICDNAKGAGAQEAALVAKGIRDVLYERKPEFYMEYPCHSPHKKRWFALTVTRFSWNNRPRLIVAHQNVTQLKQTQVELDENRKRLEAILNNVANGIVTVNATGKLESMNPAAAAIFGYAENEIVGQTLSMLFSEPQRHLSYRQLLETLQHNGEHEAVGQRKDGTLFPMYFVMTEVALGNRRIYTAIVQDVTERKRMEAELLEKERISIALQKERELREFKNRFMSVMSHELRTPLSSILLSSDLLNLYGDKAAPDEKKLYLENIRTQVEYLASLVKDMLAMSRSEVRDLYFAPEKIDLLLLCRQIIGEFQVTHQETHPITLGISGQPFMTMLDPKLMRQTLTNLISNAIKYSPERGTIQLELTYEPQRKVILSVTDRGIGIPKVDLPQLFQPFHRAGNVESIPGTGLGLSIVKQYVELHEGEIEVKSELGKGTTFTITIPYQEF